MLLNLHVRNLALIDETEIEFGRGLNVLTGETGAGKSLIIDSVNLALGGRISRGMIRKGEPEALIELVFEASDPVLTGHLAEYDIYPEDGELIISRKILASGRSVFRVNGETVSASKIKKIASFLIDIHGQHEHESLLVKKNHLKYLDAFAKKSLQDLPAQMSDAYRSYDQIRRKLKDTQMNKEERARELSFLTFEIEEIENAGLYEGEDEKLEEQYRRLSNGQKIMSALNECYQLCASEDGCASETIGMAARRLQDAASYDEGLQTLAGQLEEIDSLLGDFNTDLSRYLDDVDYSAETYEKTGNRLDEINHLKMKYGKSVSDILNAAEEKKARCEQLKNYEDYQKKLRKQLENTEKTLKKLSDRISDIRKKCAVEFSHLVEQSLRELNFLDVHFQIDFQTLDHYTKNGRDDVRFLISTNPGEPLKPLDQVASGGELSRIMLALKTILASEDEIDTLIFDEIDSGISGRTAQKVAEKMKLTARHHQILCITHLPQIAAMADCHYLIEKKAEDMHTVSSVRRLNEEESVSELARMLGGVEITRAVLDNAREMKRLAAEIDTGSSDQ